MKQTTPQTHSSAKTLKFQQQRSLILCAAAKLFAEHGFHKASMSALADACGFSKPLIYHYYKDKEEILFDIVDSYMSLLLVVSESNQLEASRHQWSTAQQFENLVLAYMREYRDSQELHMVLVQDVKFLSPPKREALLEKERQVVKSVAQLIRPILSKNDVESLLGPLTMTVFGMINWTFTWFKTQGELSHEQMAQLVSQLFLGGVGSQGAGWQTKAACIE